MKKNILIVQNYNPNKGNASVITATLYALQHEDVHIEITAAIPETAVSQYHVNCYDWLISYKKVKLSRNKARKAVALLQEGLWVCYLFLWIGFYKLGCRLLIPKRKRATIEAYERADVVVFPGGHSFTTMNGLGQVFAHCMGLHFGHIIGKKTMVYAHTIGPFKGRFARIIKWMSMYVLRRTTLVTVREKDSLRYCQDCHVKLTAETVFSIPTDKKLANGVDELTTLKQKGKTIVGLTIHHIYYKYFFSKETYLKIMADIINLLNEKYDCEVLLVPMESRTGNYNDVDMAHEIKEMIRHPQRFTILKKDYEPIITSSVIGNVDVFVGTKTHSIVYGLKAGVPTLSISYQQKANEFMDMFGVIGNAINLHELSTDRFDKVFGKMMNQLADIRQQEAQAYTVIQAKAMENKHLLMEMIR